MKTITENRKIQYDYEILEKYKAGIVLLGQEVKSIKLGRINISGAFVVLKGEEPYLLGANVPAYQPKNTPRDYEPERSRKLLLTKEEIKKLLGLSEQKGLTLKPISVYTEAGKIKIEFGLLKPKKKFDKREKIKKRETEREIERALKEK